MKPKWRVRKKKRHVHPDEAWGVTTTVDEDSDLTEDFWAIATGSK